MSEYQKKLLNLILAAELNMDGHSARYQVRDLLFNGCEGLKNKSVEQLEKEVLSRSQELLTSQEAERLSNDKAAFRAWVETLQVQEYLPF